MSYVLCISEDKKVENSYPLTLTRPVYDLRCGISTLWEKTLKAISEDTGESEENTHLLCRSYLTPVITQKNRALRVNQLKDLSFSSPKEIEQSLTQAKQMVQVKTDLQKTG